MYRRSRAKLIASLSLLAYLGLGSGLGSQFVYCVGSDGHSGIERAHDAAHGEATHGAPTLAAAESCTDIPLLVEASKEHERQSGVGSTSAADRAERLPDTRSNGSGLAREHRSVVPLERLSSLRSTVIRI